MAWIGIRPFGDRLAALTAGGRGERCGPGVLPNQHPGRGSRLHRRGQIAHVVGGQELGQLGLRHPELVRGLEVLELKGVELPVLVLHQDHQVQDPDGPGVHQLGEFRCHLAGELGHAGWELDDPVVDRSQFVDAGDCRDSLPFVREVGQAIEGRAMM